MSGSPASTLTPLAVGTSDSGDFSSWLGRPIHINDETYVMVQAGVAIAASSNGKQLAAVLSSGIVTYSAVVLSTGDAVAFLTCGAIPWTLTSAIASGAFFLAVRDSYNHVMLERGTLSGTVVAGMQLVTGTGADLVPVFTGAYLAALTGIASTSSGLGAIFGQLNAQAGVVLTADTGVVAVSGWVRYRAPFRGMD